MPRFLVKIDEDAYLEFSTVVDAPTTYICTRDEMMEYLRDEYGRSSIHENEERMRRCDEKGTSSLIDSSGESVLSFNRAGPNESCLTIEQIKEAYANARARTAFFEANKDMKHYPWEDGHPEI